MSREDTADGSSLFNDTETGSNKSFVKKVKSRVSGLFPSSLTKWFGAPRDSPKIRHREDLDEDDDTCLLQPPTKRVKLPEPKSTARTTDLEMAYLSTPLHNDSPRPNALSTKIMSFSEPQVQVNKSTRKLILPNVYNSKTTYNGDLQNGDKDSDSGESTSGYSSMPRIGSKEQVSDDKHGTPNNKLPNNISIFNSPATAERSLFGDNTRLSSPNLNSSLSSRRPCFNTSSFGSSNFMDRTLSTKRIVNSPFYSGRTSYGGASAYTRNILNRPSSELKNFVQPKPVPTVKNVTLSKTAKRILDTLEQYTSPSEDIKKIPNPPKRPQKPEGLITKYTGANPYLVRDSKVASNRELQVPTMTDVLKMKLKERLQDSTQSVRELATTSKSPLNVEEYKLRKPEETDLVRSSNKMKTKIASVRQRTEPVEILQDVKLPDVQLPISNLPNFDFNIPLPIKEAKPVAKEIPTPKPSTAMFKESTNIPLVVAKPAISKETTPSVYKFSKPLIISDNRKTIKAINNFKFSKPLSKKSECSITENFKDSSNSTLAPLKKKVNGENASISAAKELMTSGSVKDILSNNNSKPLMDQFKPAQGTWECSVCMIRNVQDKKKCAACETPRATNVSAPKPSLPVMPFGDKFKMASTQWECSVCMIRNDADKVKCAACETPKESAAPSAAPSSGGFGSQFKMTSNKWECDSCLVRNDESKTKCVACEAPKKSSVANGPKTTVASSFGDKFKPVVNSWECGTCLIRNEQDKVKCVACETPKPGSNSVKPEATLVGSLKKSEGEWECPCCMVRNPSDKVKCMCCEAAKPGCSQTIPKGLLTNDQPMPKFNFGIDKAKIDGQGFMPKTDMAPSSVFGDSAKPVTTSLNFGEKNPNGAKPTENATFSFGIPAKAEPAKSVNGKVGSEESKTVTAPTTMFTFGVKATEKKEDKVGAPVVSFGSKPEKPTETPKFGKIETTSLATTAVSSETPALFDNSATKTSASATNMFSFSASNSTTKVPTFGETPKAPTFGESAATKPAMFGESSASQAKPLSFGENAAKPPAFRDSALAKPPPAFGESSSAKPPMFGESPAKKTAFGENSVAKPAAATFGETAKVPTFTSPTPQAAQSMFGNITPNFGTAAPFTNSTPTFGGANASKPPSFGQQTPAQSSNMFGKPAATTANADFKVPTFNAPAFGSASQPAAAPTFGAPTAAPAASSTFGAPAQAVASPAFGAPSQNGSFCFSAPPAAPKASFSFCSPGPAPAAPSFSFGSNTPAPSSSSGGFNFGSTVPSFNTLAKPAFNFTAGAAPSAFTAQPSESTQAGKPPRVFRKALRRTQR